MTVSVGALLAGQKGTTVVPFPGSTSSTFLQAQFKSDSLAGIYIIGSIADADELVLIVQCPPGGADWPGGNMSVSLLLNP